MFVQCCYCGIFLDSATWLIDWIACFIVAILVQDFYNAFFMAGVKNQCWDCQHKVMSRPAASRIVELHPGWFQYTTPANSGLKCIEHTQCSKIERNTRRLSKFIQK